MVVASTVMFLKGKPLIKRRSCLNRMRRRQGLGVVLEDTSVISKSCALIPDGEVNTLW